MTGDPLSMQCSKCGAAYAQGTFFCVKDGTPLVTGDPSDPLVGQVLEGRYLLVGRLGAGGMGVVYQAQQLAIDRPVAVKLVRHNKERDKRNRQRFWIEARTVSRLEHPHIVRIYDFGTTQKGVPFLVMELLRGRSLSDLIQDTGLPLPIGRALSIIGQAAKGLAVAHNMGLVHRDIKPSNLWLESDPDDPSVERVKVIDFGLVREQATLSGLTSAHTVIGSPAYMSPEQVIAQPRLTGAVDVYALGILLYEMVTGVLPFGVTSFENMIQSHLKAEVPQTTHTVDGGPVPKEVRQLWTKALKKMPAERYPDCSAFLKAINQVSAAQPEEIGPSDRAGASDDKALQAGMQTTAPYQTITPAAQSSPNDHTGTSASAGRIRKRVTLLVVRFADRTNSEPMELEDRMDCLQPVLDAWRQALEEGEAVVEVIEGYGIRAAFGVATVREGDARTALTAALNFGHEARQAKLLERFVLRMGQHNAQIIAAPDSGCENGYRLIGQPFEVPDKIAAAAPSDNAAPVLSASAHRSLRRHLDQLVLREVRHNNQQVYVVENETFPESRRFEDSADRADLLEGPEAVIDSIVRSAQEELLSRSGAFFHVVGEPGSGLSFVLRTVRTQLRIENPEVTLVSVAPDESEHSSYSLFRNILRAVGSQHGVTPDTNGYQWVDEMLMIDRPGINAPGAETILQLIGLKGGEPVTGRANDEQKHRAYVAMVDLMGAIASRTGLVLLVDDLHSADSASLDLLTYLRTELKDFPLVVIATSRHNDALINQYPPTVSLEPLGQNDALKLVQHFDSKQRLSDAQRVAIVEQAQGLPLFIEELVHSALDTADDETKIRLPETLHAVLQARLDSLSADEQTILTRAAVVGRVFWNGAVEARFGRPSWVAEQLVHLQAKGIIEKQPVSIYGDESEWRFAHPLMWQVAYDAVLKNDREEGHLMVALWLKTRGSGVPPAHFPLIAHHFQNGRAPHEAAEAWLLAAQDQRARYANREALIALEMALEQDADWEALDLVTVQLDAGDLCNRLGEFDKATGLFEAVRQAPDVDVNARLQALRSLSRIAGHNGDREQQMALCAEAFSARDAATESESLAVLTDYIWALYSVEGPRAALRFADANNPVRLSRPGDDLWYGAHYANLQLVIAIVAQNMGRLSQAEQAVQAGLQACPREDPLSVREGLLLQQSKIYRDRLKYDKAIETVTQAIEGLHKTGRVFHEVSARLNLGWYFLADGRHLEALQVFAPVHDRHSDSLVTILKVYMFAGEAISLNAVGQTAQASALAGEALALAESNQDSEQLGWALLAKGQIAMDPDPLRDSADKWRQLEKPYWLMVTLEMLRSLVDTPEQQTIIAEIEALRAALDN